MNRVDYWSVFEGEYLWLTKYFSIHLKEIGFKSDRETTIQTLITDTGIAAYKNIFKDSLEGFTTQNLIRLKAKNIFTEWLKNKGRPQSAAIYNCDIWEDDDLDPLEQLITKQDDSNKPDNSDELREIHTILPPKAWEIFGKISKKVSYKDLAMEYDTTEEALRAQVYRWRQTLRRRYPNRSTK